MKIAIIGLGYVGLPLALQFARCGARVLGLDIDPAKVKACNSGQSYIKHIESRSIVEQVKAGRFDASGDFSQIKEVEAVIICVPTPLNKNREPDISYILKTGASIAPHLKKGMLVVLESTTYPGTTDEDLRRVLEEGCGLKAGEDFHLAYSPEREDPGNPESNVGAIPKIIGGLTPKCLERAKTLYGLAIKTIVPVSSCRAAEATKLLENIFRGVNIGLVTELNMVYDAMGIDIWEVIAAAKTKPFGFMAFYPGPGLGGDCIPIDPFYLTWKAREYGFYTEFIELAGKVNEEMPYFCRSLVSQALNHAKEMSLKGSKVLVLGVAYKPGIGDMRESPALKLISLLENAGADVAYHDPHVPSFKDHGLEMTCVPYKPAKYDCVVIVTDHSEIDYDQLVDDASLVVDLRNATGAKGTASEKVFKL